MPDIAGNSRRIFVIMKLADARIVRRLADSFLADVGAERTEIFRQPDVIFEADFLIAEENHLRSVKALRKSATSAFDSGFFKSISDISAPIFGEHGVTVISLFVSALSSGIACSVSEYSTHSNFYISEYIVK